MIILSVIGIGYIDETLLYTPTCWGQKSRVLCIDTLWIALCANDSSCNLAGLLDVEQRNVWVLCMVSSSGDSLKQNQIHTDCLFSVIASPSHVTVGVVGGSLWNAVHKHLKVPPDVSVKYRTGCDYLWDLFSLTRGWLLALQQVCVGHLVSWVRASVCIYIITCCSVFSLSMAALQLAAW